MLGDAVDAKRFTTLDGNHRLVALRALMHARADVRLVPKALSDLGIRLVIVEPLASTRIDGVCVWLDRSRPVIALSLRFDRIDSFWFALAHELGHVARRDGMENPIVDLDLLGEHAVAPETKPPAERAADEFAEDLLIPRDEMRNFIARVRPMYSKERIKGFAARLKIHPGIVVGQLAFRNQIGYWHSREMLEKVRDIVTDAALTDGWNHTAA
jgi:HTH-type transcriptional regulator/antitoxin HigA